MSDEKWLRDGLADAVPAPPETPGRAAAAESRARRTRRRTAAAAAVVGTAGVVVVVAVVAATLGSGDGATDPAGPTTAAEDVGPFDAPECPPTPAPEGGAVPGPADEPDPDAADAVPEGAVAVRLCQGIGTVLEEPADALVTDVDTLTALINDLEITGEPEMCRADLGPGYRLSFSYPDGGSFVVSSILYGCRNNVVGSTYRADSQAPLDGFVEMLRAQRSALGDPDQQPSAADLRCPDAADTPFGLEYESSVVARPEEMVAAIICLPGGERREIPPTDLEVLTADIAAHTSPASSGCSKGRQPAIIGRSAWRDTIMLGGTCGRYSVDADTEWIPSRESQAILDRLRR